MELGKTKIEFLGCEIEAGKVILQQHVLTKLNDFPEEIKDVKQLQTFLGIVNYATNSFTPEVIKYKKLLQVKLGKDYSWNWSNDDTNHVRAIKLICMNLPSLELPQEGDDLLINTDASNGYWSGVLSFRRPPSKEIRISRYCTGSWDKTATNWSIFDKELRAIKLTLQKFKMFLFNNFVLYTDNLAVISFITKEPKDTHSAKQIRDKLYINQFADYMSIKHIKGKENTLADALTRDLS